MPTEADTCRTLITPKLQAAGWEDDPHSIAEQRTFTDGRIIVHGTTARRRAGKRADYTLHFFDNSSDTPRLIFKDESGKTSVGDATLYAELRRQFAP